MKPRKGLFLICLLVAVGLHSQQRPASDFTPYVDDVGNIQRPQDYQHWAHLGTYFVVGEDESRTMHSVYAEQRHIDAYNRDGRWPDGAVLVKEVRMTEADRLTTGAANWAADPAVWFVIVKDARARFPDNPLWGDGWGWALFEADVPDVQTASNYKSDCLACHLPARQTDLVFVQGYPVLHEDSAARRMGSASMMMSAQRTMAAVGEGDPPTGSTDRGSEIFAQVCAVCHSLEPGREKVGPSLATIANDRKMPSGLAATSENILRQIDNGGNGMPAFTQHLSAQQKADLVAFVRRPR